MIKNKIFFISVLCVAMLSGCSSPKRIGEKTKAGYEAVTSQCYSEALEDFDQALLDGESSEQVYRGMGLAYMGQGDYTRAITSFKEALSCADMFPGELEYDINYYMAICYCKLERYDDAIAVYDAIIDIRSKDVEAYFLRGSMKLYLADVEGAIADFDQAIEYDKKNYGLNIDIYQVMLERGFEEEAQKYLDAVNNADTDKVSAYDKGRLCYYKGDYSQATLFLQNARTEGDTSVELMTLLCDCYRKVENYEYAISVYEAYVDSHNDPSVYNQLGLCRMEQGIYDKALIDFQNGIAIEDNNTCLQTLKLNEIACYEYMGDYDTAKLKLEEYVSIYPSNPTLEKEYAFLTTR